MRRSTSETKVEKERRNVERASKSRSVHFDGNNGDNVVVDPGELEPISIIGREMQRHSSAEEVINGNNGLSSGTDLEDLPPPPPPGKRKVIVAQRQQSFIGSLKVIL